MPRYVLIRFQITTMSTELWITFTIIWYATVINSFIVTKQDPVLPKAYVNRPDSLIVRIQPNNNIKFVKCPNGTGFDMTSLTCEFLSKKIANRLKFRRNDSSICIKDGLPVLDANIPDPTDCRYFYQCGPGSSTRTACQAGLLFNQENNACDWPTQALCCEFRGGDPSKLVVPLSEY